MKAIRSIWVLNGYGNCRKEKMTLFGTSQNIDAVRKSGLRPAEQFDLRHLRIRVLPARLCHLKVWVCL